MSVRCPPGHSGEVSSIKAILEQISLNIWVCLISLEVFCRLAPLATLQEVQSEALLGLPDLILTSGVPGKDRFTIKILNPGNRTWKHPVISLQPFPGCCAKQLPGGHRGCWRLGQDYISLEGSGYLQSFATWITCLFVFKNGDCKLKTQRWSETTRGSHCSAGCCFYKCSLFHYESLSCALTCWCDNDWMNRWPEGVRNTSLVEDPVRRNGPRKCVLLLVRQLCLTG